MNLGFKEAIEIVILAIAFVVWLIRLENKVKDSSALSKQIDDIRREFADKLTELERSVNDKFDEARRDTKAVISEARTSFMERLGDLKEVVSLVNRKVDH